MQRDGSVEIVATLGDTVLDVHRVERAARGRVAPITWAILGAGFAAIAAAGALFAIALDGAAADAQRLDEWVALRRPLYGFRSHAPFGGTHALHASDVLVLAALVAGIALVVVAILRAAGERRFPGYRLGDVAIRVDQPLPARVQCGLVTLTASRVVEAPIVVPRGGGDREVRHYLVASLAVHACMLVILAQHVGVRALGIEGERAQIGDTFVEDYESAQEREEVDVDEESDGGGGGHEAPSPTSMALPESTYELVPSQLPPDEARAQAIAAARSASIIGSARLESDIRTLLAAADLSGGFSASGIYTAGEQDGGFTFGLRSFGAGGGGPGFGTSLIIAGRYGTKSGSGYGYAGGIGNLIGRQPAVPTVTMCGRHIDGTSCVLAMGDLDKAILRRYIRRELPKFQYCYEHELLAKHDLHGTVTTQFLIAIDGSVATANAQGMDDAVSACVAGVIKNIQFPKSVRGGTTQVTYPFTFQTPG
jgi:hypothetical protein